MTIDDARNWAELGVIAAGIIGGGWRIMRRLERRLDKQDLLTAAQIEEIKSIKDENARQYGGNSGGMREAINQLVKGQDEIKSDLKYQRTRLDAHIDSHD